MTATRAEPCAPKLIAAAERAAEASGAIIRAYFRSGVVVHDKEDSSPVTAADREAETAIRAVLVAECPGHGVIGEEHGSERAGADHVWVIDPIDGTKSFIAGIPVFGTLIALLRAGVPILGVIDQPILGERWVGALGHGTRFNGRPTRTRACPELAGATLYTTSPDMYARGDDRARFERLRSAVKLARYGGDCYATGVLALGCIDLQVEASLAPYDYCALVPVVEGAGGVISDWEGRALGLESDGRIIAAGDRRAHEAALGRLAGATSAKLADRARNP